MSKIVYCGEKTCNNNFQGKCKKRKVGVNENGVCLGYSPLFAPNMNVESEEEIVGERNEETEIQNSFDGNKNVLGFKGNDSE